MTNLPDHDAQASRLLDAERLRDELPETDIDEAWQRFAEKLPAMTGAMPGDPTSPDSPKPGSSSAGSDAGGASSTARLVKLGAALLVTFGAGVMTGRLLPAEARRETGVVQPVASLLASSVDAPIAPIPPPTASSAAAILPSPSPPRSAAASRPASTSTSTAPSASTRPVDTLSDERALVEGARTALLRGRPSDALELARKHEARFVNGELAEDRDFMIASALHDLGRVAEARAQARQFLARYPKSALRQSAQNLAD